MSTMKEKVSAFSVFKARKATSLTNVMEATPKHKPKKASSANTTPTNSKQHKGLSAIINKITQSERKKQDVKKAKKLLKSASKSERGVKGVLMESPLLGNTANKRPRVKSQGGDSFALPLKATPAAIKPDGGSHQVGIVTPPLPPRRPIRNASIKSDTNSIKSTTKPVPAKRLASQGGHMSPPASNPPPRRSIPVATTNKPKSIQSEPGPPKAMKRRRLSDKSDGAPSPKQALYTGSPLAKESSVAQSDRRSCHRGLPYMYDSQQEASKLFDCLIHPVKSNKFFSELWERKPLLVKRHMENYNDGWFSSAELDRILREERLAFTINVDVVSYINGKRETHNPPGRAYAPVVWDYFQNGCSVRVLNPQTYSHNVWKLLSILQEYFGCCVGANIYLTPPGTQGFAPHYDDIEAFILQLEGKKHWKLYSPRTEGEALPRTSSGNFTDTDIGEPILDVILEAGDLLYFPRGTIHQGRTLEDTHSLHITVSCMQRNSWGDLLEQLVPQALSTATEEDIDFRKSLPRDYLNYMGVAFSDKECPARQQFLRTVERLMKKLVTALPVDAACDQMAKKYIHDSLPPVLTEGERQCSTHGNGEHWHPEERRVTGAVELEPDTMVKLIRKGCLRLVSEEERVLIYHNLENARVYHGNDVQCVEISAEFAPAVEHLLHSYPEHVRVDDLPLDSVQDRVEVAAALYDKGLLVTSLPLQPVSDDESDHSIENHATDI